MAAVCQTDPDTLGAVFYVRKFTSANSDIRQMSEWFKSYGVQDVCMESTGKYWIPVYDILEHQGLKPVLTHPKYVKLANGLPGCRPHGQPVPDGSGGSFFYPARRYP